jgi:hypothetical protein
VIGWTAVAAIVAALAVVVSLCLFIVDSRRRAAEERARLKREAISRLLDSMEISIRKNQGMLSALRFWAHPDIEYALSVPRLLHDLGPGNLAISGWAFRQVQAIVAAPSDKRATELGIAMAMKIVEWGQGSVRDEWFRAELRKDPMAPDFRVRRMQRVQRGWDRMKRSTVALVGLFLVGGALIEAMRLLPEVVGEARELGLALLARIRRLLFV